ncbi:hypothetical protein KGA66_13795 [Actinocrinis puniceicyclus]|uniref:DUF11 domain-containing protein n=1 Tax=Actinocrinis puniceicyclus TaxID=977794 RepID=A0A8J7WKR3_9ACTN|nr:hypothetical protein [Actinocrinis puniceicyclus]MBS2964126.1 hypothetical protein [Actinocrinis puniceicyclus]
MKTTFRLPVKAKYSIVALVVAVPVVTAAVATTALAITAHTTASAGAPHALRTTVGVTASPAGLTPSVNPPITTNTPTGTPTTTGPASGSVKLSAGIPTSAPSMSPATHTTSTLPAGAISAQLTGIPATITAGGPAVEFTATFTNHSTIDASDVAPLFQIVGGPCNCAQGTLQRFNTATGAWQNAPMPEGDGNPGFLATAIGGIDLQPGASTTIRYRLALSASNPAKSLAATLYAVELPGGTQLARTSLPSRLTAG